MKNYQISLTKKLMIVVDNMKVDIFLSMNPEGSHSYMEAWATKSKNNSMYYFYFITILLLIFYFLM